MYEQIISTIKRCLNGDGGFGTNYYLLKMLSKSKISKNITDDNDVFVVPSLDTSYQYLYDNYFYGTDAKKNRRQLIDTIVKNMNNAKKPQDFEDSEYDEYLKKALETIK